MYSDNTSKFVTVLNRKIELPKLFNALGHVTVGLASLTEASSLALLDYRDANQSPHGLISRYPFIVLQSDNGNQIRTLRQKLISEGLPYTDFVDKMLGASAEEQMASTRATKDEDFEYFAICTFGPAVVLDPMVKKFSLYRGPASDGR